MSVCTFFGHRNCSECIKNPLAEEIEICITQRGIDKFYVGHQGKFDEMIVGVLQKMKERYPHIQYTVVLAYHPKNKKGETVIKESVLPEGIERVPPRYAIDFRNRWMLDQSDIVLAYVVKSYGGAARFVEKAKKQGKTVINVAEKIT